MPHLEEFLKETRESDGRVSSMFQADSTLPAGVYGDLDTSSKRGMDVGTGYRSVKSVTDPQAPSDEQINQAAIETANRLRGRRPKKKKTFWSGLNNLVARLMPGVNPYTGKSYETGKKVRFTDRANDFLEFTQHVGRTLSELDYQAIGKPTEPVSGEALVEDPLALIRPFTRLAEEAEVYFNPRAWRSAWRKTKQKEDYFVGERDVKTELPEFGREVVKRVVGWKHTPEQIAQDYNIDQRLIELIVQSGEGQKYAKELDRRQVTVGRSVAGPDDSLSSGTIDAFVALFGEPDVFVGEIIAGARAVSRTIPAAARRFGGLDALRTHPKMAKFLEFATEETSPERIVRLFSRKGTTVPPKLAHALAAAPDEDVAWEIVKQAAQGGRGADEFLFHVPHTSIWAKTADKIIQVDVDANSVGRHAAGLLRRANSLFADEPKAFDLQDTSDAYQQVKGMLNAFPRAFTYKERGQILDTVLGAKNTDEVAKIAMDVADRGGTVLKVPERTRTVMTRLLNQYWKLRAWNVSTDTGDELSTKVIQTANGMIEKAFPHGYHEGMQRFPMWTPRELRDLRWAQGSFTKYFLSKTTGQPNVLGKMWMGPHWAIRGVWVPIQLITRVAAYPLRIQLDNQARLMVLGKGFAQPREHLRAIGLRGEFKDYLGHTPPDVSFLRHPLKYVGSLLDVDGIPEGVLTGKQALFRGTRRQVEKGRAFEAVPFETDPYGVHGWQYMVGQTLEDPVGRQLLAQRSVGEVSDWLTGDDGRYVYDALVSRGTIADPSNPKTFPTAPYKDADDYVESWVERNAHAIHGNEELERTMRAVADGSLSPRMLRGKDGREFLEGMPNPPLWVKRDVALSASPEGWWSRAQEVMFRYIMDIPDARLARIPMWLETTKETERTLLDVAQREGNLLDDVALKSGYTPQWEQNMSDRVKDFGDLIDDATVRGDWDEMVRLGNLRRQTQRRLARGPYKSELDTLAGLEGFLTPRVIRESAKSHAANRTIAILYDPTRRNRMERVFETQFPFLAAWREFVETWTRIMTERPQNIGRAVRTISFVSEPPDPFDETYVAGFKDSGRSVVAYPFKWLVHSLTGSGTNFTTPFESLNLVTQNRYPATGPMGQFLASIISEKKPDYEDFLSWVGGEYGLRYAREKGVSGYLRLGLDSFLPAWGRTALLWLESPESSVEMTNRTAREFQQLALEKYKDLERIPWGESGEIQGLLDQAETRARRIVLIQAFGKMVWPGTLAMNYPQQPLIDRIRTLKDTLGEDKAMEQAVKELGPGAEFLNQPLTSSMMPATQKAREMWDDPQMRKLVQQHGGLFWALMENEVQRGEPFDYNVWKWQLSSGQRKGKAIGFQLDPNARQYAPGWVESAQIDEAWRRLDGARKRGEERLAAGEITERSFNETMKRLKVKLGNEYPAWAMSQVQMTNDLWRLRNLKRDMGILAKGLKGKDSANGLGKFLVSLESAQSARERADLSPDSFEGTSGAAVRIRTALKRAAERIADEHPDFRPFFVRHLRFFLEPEGAEIEEPVVRMLEAVG